MMIEKLVSTSMISLKKLGCSRRYSSSVLNSAKAKKSYSSGGLQEDVIRLCRQRGFVYPGSSVYGGLANSYDYGPLGVQLKKNIQDAWWRDFIVHRVDCVGLDSSIMLSSKVWEASGHIENFTDPMTVCTTCNSRIRADKLLEDIPDSDITEAGGLSIEDLTKLMKQHGVVCPVCGSHDLGEPKMFNLLFKTAVGSTEQTSDCTYLRPETAQGAYINFPNVMSSMRKRLPFGIGQMGKSFRNEISPGHFLFRTREFEQLELQYFCHPESSASWYQYWVDFCHNWLLKYGVRGDNIRKREHSSEELAHYASATTDIEYKYPFGWGELWGVANRGNYDLTKHMNSSGKDFRYADVATNEKCLPHVVEPALGVGRVMLAILLDAFDVEHLPGVEERRVLRLHPHLSPFKIAVLPLSKNPNLAGLSEVIYTKLSKKYAVDYDFTGSIGKRYRRQDEIGTPICVTIDFESLEDGAVTIRARDSMQQKRIQIEHLLTNGVSLELFNELNGLKFSEF